MTVLLIQTAIIFYGIFVLIFFFCTIVDTKRKAEINMKLSPRWKLVIVLIPAAIILAGLLIANAYFTWTDLYDPMLNEQKNTLMLDGKLTSSGDGNAYYVINNKDKTSKTLFVYGLDNESALSLSFSKIADDTSNTYDLSFCSDHRMPIPKLTFIKNATNPYQGNICIYEHINPGIYEGLFLIQGKNNTSIPITLTTEPKVYVATIWIIIGIMMAIIIWEIIHYFDIKQQAYSDVEKGVIVDSSQQGYKSELRQLYSNDYLDTYVNKRFNFPTAPKLAIVDIGTVVLGIAVGFFSSLNEPTVIGTRIFTPLVVLSLIGIGLGIGSLRELFTRPKATD